jgi:hypothetical protein
MKMMILDWVRITVGIWVCRNCGITCHCHQTSHLCSVAMKFKDTEFRPTLPMCCLCSMVFRCVHWSCIPPVLQLWFTQTPIIFTITIIYWCHSQWGSSCDSALFSHKLTSYRPICINAYPVLFCISSLTHPLLWCDNFYALKWILLLFMHNACPYHCFLNTINFTYSCSACRSCLMSSCFTYYPFLYVS